jgi:hypothetical protein
MSVIAASLLILVLPVVLFGLMTYGLWKRGILGRILLMSVFMCGAVEAHSIIYPQKNLKARYAQAIG